MSPHHFHEFDAVCLLSRGVDNVDDLMADIAEQQDLALEISEAISKPYGFNEDFDEVRVAQWVPPCHKLLLLISALFGTACTADWHRKWWNTLLLCWCLERVCLKLTEKPAGVSVGNCLQKEVRNIGHFSKNAEHSGFSWICTWNWPDACDQFVKDNSAKTEAGHGLLLVASECWSLYLNTGNQGVLWDTVIWLKPSIVITPFFYFSKLNLHSTRKSLLRYKTFTASVASLGQSRLLAPQHKVFKMDQPQCNSHKSLWKPDKMPQFKTYRFCIISAGVSYSVGR